jgi:hypothetical protein
VSSLQGDFINFAVYSDMLDWAKPGNCASEYPASHISRYHFAPYLHILPMSGSSAVLFAALDQALQQSIGGFFTGHASRDAKFLGRLIDYGNFTLLVGALAVADFS